MAIEDTLAYIAARSITIESERDADFEVQNIKLPHTASRKQVQRLLTDEAEYGHWELKRLRRYRDGSSEVWLRRKIIKVRSTLRTA